MTRFEKTMNDIDDMVEQYRKQMTEAQLRINAHLEADEEIFKLEYGLLIDFDLIVK